MLKVNNEKVELCVDCQVLCNYKSTGLVNIKKNKYYSEEVKIQSVRDYLQGKESQNEICKQNFKY